VDDWLAKKELVYLRERAERSSQEDFERALFEIPDVEPEEFDKL
jgi:hypothetical protein